MVAHGAGGVLAPAMRVDDEGVLQAGFPEGFDDLDVHLDLSGSRHVVAGGSTPVDALALGIVAPEVRKVGQPAIAVGLVWRQEGAQTHDQLARLDGDGHALTGQVQRVGAADVPTPYAKNLEQLALPSARQIFDAVLKITL